MKLKNDKEYIAYDEISDALVVVTPLKDIYWWAAWHPGKSGYRIEWDESTVTVCDKTYKFTVLGEL